MSTHGFSTNDLSHNILLHNNFPINSVDWLTKLIAFDSTSRESNLALIEYVQDFCQALGLQKDRDIYQTWNSEKTKANVFISVPAGDNADDYQAGIVLSGHTDVVPVDGQVWTDDPFDAVVRDGKLYGRGACDMKGFIACVLNVLPTMVALSNAGNLTRPIHVALSYDEEVGCLGAPIMLADIKHRGIHPEYCIVGEPSNMNMVVAHKGINVFCCRVHGKSTHSSLTPQGVNAISYASRLIGYIDDLAETFQQRDDLDTLYDVPFSTLSVGTIHGGTATNIVPNFCQFTFDYRNLPFMRLEEVVTPIQQKIDALNAQMQKIDKNTGIEIEQLEQVPAMTDAENEQLQMLVNGLLNSDVDGVDKDRDRDAYDGVADHKKNTKNTKKVAYATEGGQFSNADIATVICGPGSIEQAHRADEFITLEQLHKCDKFLEKLVVSCTVQ